MALSDEELDAIRSASLRLNRAKAPMERLDAYYNGMWRLEQLGLAVPPELSRFVTVVNWPRIAADSVEQRCDVEGFRIGGTDAGADADDVEDADQELWDIWQANDLDEESQLAHLDAIVLSRSYACVGSRDEDDDSPDIAEGTPLITIESPFDMTHEVYPRTRRLRHAFRRSSPNEATLYLPDETIWIERSGARGGWQDVDRDEHGIGYVPVVPLVNRPRTRNRDGVSELADVISLTDAACRALTNAQVATEVLAVPQRYAIGAAQKDFVDQDGKALTAWETYFGAVWALQNKDAKVGQFTPAELSNFERIVTLYANLMAGVTGLPTRFFGQYTTNPPSEGSIVADETRLIMNAYRKHRAWGGSWERVMRLARRLVDGDWNPDLARMETLWRNPETPTRAQAADAATKLVGADILPVEAAWEDLGYSATRRKRLKAMMAEQRANDPLSQAADAVRGATIPAGTAPDADTEFPPMVPGVDPAAADVER